MMRRAAAARQSSDKEVSAAVMRSRHVYGARYECCPGFAIEAALRYASATSERRLVFAA